MIDILIFLMRPALLFLDNPLRYWYFFPTVLPAWLADIFVAHTTWALVAGFPRIGEVTVSDTLERLCNDITNPDCLLFVEIARKINRAVGFTHIKAVA
jgi:hypothetical protein